MPGRRLYAVDRHHRLTQTVQRQVDRLRPGRLVILLLRLAPRGGEQLVGRAQVVEAARRQFHVTRRVRGVARLGEHVQELGALGVCPILARHHLFGLHRLARRLAARLRPRPGRRRQRAQRGVGAALGVCLDDSRAASAFPLGISRNPLEPATHALDAVVDAILAHPAPSLLNANGRLPVGDRPHDFDLTPLCHNSGSLSSRKCVSGYITAKRTVIRPATRLRALGRA